MDTIIAAGFVLIGVHLICLFTIEFFLTILTEELLLFFWCGILLFLVIICRF